MIDVSNLFKEEFGPKFKTFLLRMEAETVAHASEILVVVSD